jgi:hypothetical protein
MIAPFDIFQSESGGAVIWRGTADTLNEAKAIIGKLAGNSPGEYIILSRVSGNKTTFWAGEAEFESPLDLQISAEG